MSATSTDPRLARPRWRDGRTNVDALTIACIERAEKIVRKKAPALAHAFVVTQGSYQDGHGDENSAGTHDLGGVVDLRWCGHQVCLWALRKAGTFASHRTPKQGPWVDHIHVVVVGHPYLAGAAAAQISDYYLGLNGLAGHGPDDGPSIRPIPLPKWPWPGRPARIVRMLAETKVEIERVKKARRAARLRGEPVEPYKAVLKKLRGSRRKAKGITR